jgi:hypothetical protein
MSLPPTAAQRLASVVLGLCPRAASTTPARTSCCRTRRALRVLTVALKPELLPSGKQSYRRGLLALDPVTAAPAAPPRRTAGLGGGYRLQITPR